MQSRAFGDVTVGEAGPGLVGALSVGGDMAAGGGLPTSAVSADRSHAGMDLRNAAPMDFAGVDAAGCCCCCLSADAAAADAARSGRFGRIASAAAAASHWPPCFAPCFGASDATDAGLSMAGDGPGAADSGAGRSGAAGPGGAGGSGGSGGAGAAGAAAGCPGGASKSRLRDALGLTESARRHTRQNSHLGEAGAWRTILLCSGCGLHADRTVWGRGHRTC